MVESTILIFLQKFNLSVSSIFLFVDFNTETVYIDSQTHRRKMFIGNILDKKF